MRINFKLRLKNKTTLISLLVTLTAATYQILQLLGITPSIPYKVAEDAIYIIVSAFAAVGIVVDPTTKGVSDSEKAMTYSAPSDSNLDLSVVHNPISDDNETVSFKAGEDATEDKEKYTPSDLDADITRRK